MGSVPLEGPYKTIAVPPDDIALLLQALEYLFDSEAAGKRNTQKLEHVRDVHDFLRRTLTENNG